MLLRLVVKIFHNNEKERGIGYVISKEAETLARRIST